MKKPRKNSRQTKLKKIRKIHTVVSTVLFFSYILLSMTYSPEFLFSDIRSKFSALADNKITLTAKVLAPPVKPAVSTIGACRNGVFKIRLTWPNDENSTDYDIFRNGFPLASALSSLPYVDRDDTKTADTVYSYVVTAHGPMSPGFADSDPVTITSPPVCEGMSAPPISVVIPFNPNNDGNMDNLISNNTSRLLFRGTTNIPYAIITIEIHSQQIVYAQIMADASGNWSWSPSVDIENGQHTIYTTAQDPFDPSLTILAQAHFVIDYTDQLPVAGSSDKKSKGHDQNKQGTALPTALKKIPPLTASNPAESFAETPLTYSLYFQNDSVRPGDNMRSIVSIEKVDPNYDGFQSELNYEIYDFKGKLILSKKDNVVLSVGRNIEKIIYLPAYLQDGEYKLKTSFKFDSFIVEQDRVFHITPAQLLNFGGSVFVAYPQFLSTMGTVSMICILLLLIWIFIFLKEYWLFIHSARHITEKTLEKFGMISTKKRKGVSR